MVDWGARRGDSKPVPVDLNVGKSKENALRLVNQVGQMQNTLRVVGARAADPNHLSGSECLDVCIKEINGIVHNQLLHQSVSSSSKTVPSTPADIDRDEDAVSQHVSGPGF